MKQMTIVFVQSVALAMLSPAHALAHGSGAHIMGKVRAIDGPSLVVEEKSGKEQTIALDEETKFEKGGTSAAASDLQVGDRVVVHARREGDKLVAEIVRLSATSRSDAHQGHDARDPRR